MRNRNLFTTVRRALFAVVCVAAALGMVAMPQQASAKKGKKIGIQLYSVMLGTQPTMARSSTTTHAPRHAARVAPTLYPCGRHHHRDAPPQ